MPLGGRNMGERGGEQGGGREKDAVLSDLGAWPDKVDGGTHSKPRIECTTTTTTTTAKPQSLKSPRLLHIL